MDNFETESNCSYYSDSLQSNASSLSGLSLYGNEFAELRHLVNPSKYPQPYLERCSTPKPEIPDTVGDDKFEQLKKDLRQSQELNERYKVELHNLEKKIELKFCDKVDKLLRSNSRLEGELENAQNQIERLIRNYNDKQDYLVFKEKLDLEKRIYQLSSDYSSLQKQYAKTQQEKNETELDNKNLKITLGELLTERNIKNTSVQSLKQKISEQHIEIQNSLKENSNLAEKINFLSTNLIESEKSKIWYKEQLTACQKDKLKLKEELITCKNQAAEFNDRISSLNINLTKLKNEVDEVRLQALKEKEELYRKLENINLDCTILKNVPESINNLNKPYSYDIQFYEQTVQDLRDEISRMKAAILEKDEEFEKINEENSAAISKCLVLQKTLMQKEADIELLENSKCELLKKLEYLKECEKDKLCVILQLKNRITELEIEGKSSSREKGDVDESIQLVRDQFFKFKQNYDKVKNELHVKNKDILQLQKDKQELFMNNNWTICELEKFKQKDAIIEHLKKENKKLVTEIELQTQQIREAELQKSKNDKIINENEYLASELENQNKSIEHYKTQMSEYEEKICQLQSELKEISCEFIDVSEAYDEVKVNITEKDSKLSESLRIIELQRSEHQNSLADKNNILLSYKNLEEKYQREMYSKNQLILDLKSKINKLENEWQSYIKRITDDQKVELLLNNQKCFSLLGLTSIRKINGLSVKSIGDYILNTFNNLNVEELESSVDIRLKYLDERVNKIKEKSAKLQEALTGGNKVKELEILLQVKERDMQEKRKKMDKNNRTLLRKVKEHMRGRNSAEKQLKYLQDLYNALADDHNTSTLSLGSKEREIQSLQEFCEGYKKEIEKLRNTAVNLEQALSKARICGRCIEMEQVKEKLTYFKELCNDISQRNGCLEEELISDRECIKSLTKQNAERDFANKSLQQEIAGIRVNNENLKGSLSKLCDAERENVLQRELINNLENVLLEKESLYQKSLQIAEKNNQDLIEAKDKVLFLSDEIRMYSFNLQQKVEHSKELEDKFLKLEQQYSQENINHENVMVVYKQRILSLQNHVKVLKNDRFFLRRLSNDLKVALNAHVEHNKKLQDQLKLLNNETQPFKSLPINLPGDVSFSGKYDENHISRLLEENRAPPTGKPMTAEIRGCLDKLREEIFSLQDQISRKNNRGNLGVG